MYSKMTYPQSWFRSLSWDFTWLLSAYWIFPLFFFLYLQMGDTSYTTMAAMVFIGSRLAHIYFSMYLCVGHPAYKEVSRENKGRFYVIPALMVFAITLFFSLPETILPQTTDQRFKLYAFATFPYVYWHYALQHYGVISMYRGKAGQQLGSFHRSFEKWFCHLSVSLVITALTLNNFYDVAIGGYSFKQFFMAESVNWNMIAWSLILPLTLIYLYLELRLEKKSVPKILYILSMSAMSLVLTFDTFLISWLLLDMQHTLVVFGLGGHILSKYEVKKTGMNPTVSLTKQYAYMVMVSLFFSVIHFYFNANGASNKMYGVFYDGLIPQADETFFRTFFYGFFISLGIVHYYYDRLAFRLSDPKIGPVLKKIMD